MVELTLRGKKGSPLTNQELDDNFSNLEKGISEKTSLPKFSEVLFPTYEEVPENWVDLGERLTTSASTKAFIVYVPGHIKTFSSDKNGIWIDPSDADTLFIETSEATVQSLVGNPVGTVLDKSRGLVPSSNTTVFGNHLTSPDFPSRPTLGQTENGDRYLVPNLSNDNYQVELSDTINGTMILSMGEGTATYLVDIPADTLTLGKNGYWPGSKIFGIAIRDTEMTSEEIDHTVEYMKVRGGGDDYSEVTNFMNFWRDWNFITQFPEIDVSNGTNFSNTWRDCSSLEHFLTSFENVTATNFSNAFLNTNLSEESIDDILISIESNDTSDGTFDQSGGSEPSLLGLDAIDELLLRNWNITVTGGYSGWFVIDEQLNTEGNWRDNKAW